MQVNAIGDGGKAKKGKGKKGNGKGKGKDNNKSKNGDACKGKDRDNNWISGQQATQFQGCCSHCAKWGHKRAECRTRLAHQKAGAVAGVQQPEDEGEGVKSAQWSDTEHDDMEIVASS